MHTVAAFHLGVAIQYILYAIAVMGIVRFFVKPKEQKLKWTAFESIAVTIAAYFLSQIVVQIILQVLVQFIAEDSLERYIAFPSIQFMFAAISYGTMVGTVVLFMKQRNISFKQLGVVPPKLRDVGYAFAGFVTYFIGYGIVVQQLVTKYLQIDTNQKQDIGFDTGLVGPELIFVMLTLLVLAPFAEEFITRGFLYTGLKKQLPIIPAAIITSIIFGSAHLQWGSDAPLLWTAAIDTFCLSMVLVWLRQKTGSIWAGIGLHLIKNSIAFLVLFIFKVG